MGHWMFVENGGTNAYNIARDKYDGAITNATWSQTGTFKGPELAFDASGDYVDCGTNTDHGGLTKVSISAWIYPRSVGETTNGITFGGGILTRGATSNGWGFFLARNGSSQLSVRGTSCCATTNMNRRTADDSILINTRYHIGASMVRGTNQAAADCHIYINGVEPTYQTTTNGVGTLTNEVNVNLEIGNTYALAQTFDGFIDDVRLYNRILTREDFISLYNDPFLEFDQPVRRWPHKPAAAAATITRKLLVGVGR